MYLAINVYLHIIYVSLNQDFKNFIIHNLFLFVFIKIHNFAINIKNCIFNNFFKGLDFR